MAEFFPRTRGAAQTPTPDERLADLIELHTARPAVTEATLGACTTADGRTGYQVLAQQVDEAARAVLDLGCGSGPLLEAVWRARPRVARLAGADLCAGDLAIARSRLPVGRADLRREAAQALSFEDVAFDAVLSHHAFYLFEPLEPAVREAARVLRPGGLFACVTWSFTAEREALFAKLMVAMGEHTRRENPHFDGWGDRRNFRRDALEALLAAHGFAPSLAVEEHALVLREPAGTIADRLLGFFYSAELLRPETRASLRAAWVALLADTQDESGLARLMFPFSLTTIRKHA